MRASFNRNQEAIMMAAKENRRISGKARRRIHTDNQTATAACNNVTFCMPLFKRLIQTVAKIDGDGYEHSC